MAKPRKPSKTARYDAAFSELMEEVSRVKKSGIKFDFPAPTKPATITEESIRQVHALKEYVRSIKTPNVSAETMPRISMPEQQPIPTPHLTSEQPYISHPRMKSDNASVEKQADKLSPEELSRIRKEQALKRVENLTPEERRQWYEDIRRKTAERYTPEELAKMRSEAAKKAAVTRRLKKQAREEALEEFESELLPEEIVDLSPKKDVDALTEFENNLQPEETADLSEEYMRTAPAMETQTKYDNVIAILSGAHNKNTADYLIQLAEEQRAIYGDAVFFKHFERVAEEAEESANGVAYSSEQDELRYNAGTFLFLISVDSVNSVMQEELASVIKYDIPYDSYATQFQIMSYKKRK